MAPLGANWCAVWPNYLLRGDVPLSTRLRLGRGVSAKAVQPLIEGLISENADTRLRWAERLSG